MVGLMENDNAYTEKEIVLKKKTEYFSDLLDSDEFRRILKAVI